MPKNLDPGFGKTPKQLAKIFGVSEKEIKRVLKQISKDVTKPVKKTSVTKTSNKSDGMLSSKEAGKVYKKATNKAGKYDPTKIPGFSYGKGTR